MIAPRMNSYITGEEAWPMMSVFELDPEAPDSNIWDSRIRMLVLAMQLRPAMGFRGRPLNASPEGTGEVRI